MDVSSFFSPKGNEPGSLWQHIDNLSFSNVFFFWLQGCIVLPSVVSCCMITVDSQVVTCEYAC